MARKETLKQIYNRCVNDPSFMESKDIKNAEKYGAASGKLAADIAAPLLEYAVTHGKDDAGWNHTIMVSLARATCDILCSLQHAQEGPVEKRADVFSFYTKELLPLCYEIVSESEQEQEDIQPSASLGDGGVPYETKKEIILAIADKNLSADDIISKFFLPDISDDLRKNIAASIDKMRITHSDRLRRILEIIPVGRADEKADGAGAVI